MDFTITIGLISLLAVLYYYFKHYSFTIINDSHQPRRLKPQWLLGRRTIFFYQRRSEETAPNSERRPLDEFFTIEWRISYRVEIVF